ncbi:tetratricopeptide repeat protein [Delftia tsuruhatensis]|uniref:tetratricopeptide repeat protein n=1 Tax=Delftia tsuruhatensis TaxID=180282 RepID=UPI0012AA9889|nr:hypothetical protein [Delftia tsuruhatensis]QFS66493.1 hypothetical protein GCS91_20340 [Delftia tsuruhatensis]
MKSSLPQRRLIPRWRPVSQTLFTSEIESTLTEPKQKLVFNQDLFRETVAAWRNNPTAGHLGDIISFSPDDELRPTIIAIIDEALKLGYAVSETQRSIFSEVQEQIFETNEIQTTNNILIQTRVSKLRHDLLVAPDNVLALLDMAQLQLAAGKQVAAKRYLRTALSLAPNGRIVLRTAARFFVHQGEPDRAHALIARHPASKEDPWLMASEIALAQVAGKSSLHLNTARRILRTTKRSSRQLAELAGAVSSRVLLDGKLKEARPLLRLALEQPTDNVVAQAMTEARYMGLNLDEPTIQRAVKQSSEAQLLQSWVKKDESASEKYAMKWHAEEPFSSRPLQFLTCLYSLQGKYHKALEWVERGLVADPIDSGLIINLSFTQAAVGNDKAAENTIKKARSIDNVTHEPFFKATEGLIALRKGELELADRLYREAEEIFKKTHREDLAALSSAYYAKFASEFRIPNAEALKKEANEKVKKAPTIDAQVMLGRLNHQSPTLSNEDRDKQRRLSQWVFDPTKNTLTQTSVITAPGAPGFIVRPTYTPTKIKR